MNGGDCFFDRRGAPINGEQYYLKVIYFREQGLDSSNYEMERSEKSFRIAQVGTTIKVKSIKVADP